VQELVLARNYFDRSLEVDKASRESLVEVYQKRRQVYSADETTSLDEGMARFRMVDSGCSRVKMLSPLVRATKSSSRWGWATATIRARPEHVLAFLLDSSGRQNM
jgi:hypothetical protein